MSDALLIVLFVTAVVLVGLLATWMVGIPLRGRWSLTAIGLAPMTGLAVLGTVSVVAAVTDLGVRLWVVLPGSLLLIALLAPVRQRLTLWPLRPASSLRGATVGEVAVLAAGGIVAIRAVRAYLATPLEAWDGWAIWGAHAHVLFAQRSLYVPSFRDPVYVSQHPEYPVSFSSLEALSSSALGRFDTQLIHVIPAVFVVSLGLAAWGVLRTLIPPVLAAAAAVFVFGSSGEIGNLRDNYADGAVAGLAAVGVLLVAVWLVHGSGSALGLATVLLAAAGLTKTEGFLFSAAAFLAATLVSVLAGRRVGALAGCAAIALSLPLAWQVFARAVISTNGSYDWSVLVRKGTLGDSSARFREAMTGLGDALINNWSAALLVLLISLALAVVSLRWRLATYTILWFSFSLVGLGIVYVVSTDPIDWHLATSAYRVVTTVAVGSSLLAAWIAVDAWDQRVERATCVAREGEGLVASDPA